MPDAKPDTVQQLDLPSWLFKKQQAKIRIEKKTRRLRLALLPAIGYTPANGFVFGAAVSASTNLGDPATTRPSSALLNGSVTTKDQVIFVARTGIALRNNDYLIESDTRLLFFTQDTYGLGIRTGAPGSGSYARPEPMRFNYIRLYVDGFRRISQQLYAGLGLAFDMHSNIRDEALNLNPAAPYQTAHYQYGQQNNLPVDRYSANGLQFTLRWDSRDNIANPYKGWFASITSRMDTRWLGSTRREPLLMLEGRYYWNLQPSRPRHLLAFWLKAAFSQEGDRPYLSLPAIGWDTYNRTGRGYIQGRFRGDDLFYTEAEYRFPITRNGLLGGVAFANMTSVSGPQQKLLGAVAPAAGAGLRIQLDKAARTNITVDYARGVRSSGVFFSLQEAF